MPKTKDIERVLITLVDKDGIQVERKITSVSLLRVATFLKLKSNLDRGDKIIVESEEL